MSDHALWSILPDNLPDKTAGARDSRFALRVISYFFLDAVRCLEPISQMPEQDANASEVHEAEKVLGMALIAGDESPVVPKPREEPLDSPATSHAAKRTAILSLRAPAVAAVPGDQLDSSLLS